MYAPPRVCSTSAWSPECAGCAKTKNKSIDAGELEVYVELETDHLSKQIESILGKNGSFPTYQSAQFYVINQTMEKMVKEWNAGQIMAKQEWYERQDFAMANSIVGMVDA